MNPNVLVIYDADSLVWTELDAERVHELHSLAETIALTSKPELTAQRYREAEIDPPTIIDQRRGRLVDDILDHCVGRDFVWLGLHLRRDDFTKLAASDSCLGIYEMVPGEGLSFENLSRVVARLSV